MELGRHLGDVRLPRRQLPRDRVQEWYCDENADKPIEEIAYRQAAARRIASNAGFDERIDRTAEIGTEH